MSDNKNLNRAQAVSNDEFYTRYEVIEFFMTRIDPSEFKDKIVYCNCDWPESNYVKYYKNNFKRLGLKKLIATGIFDFMKTFDWHGTYYEYDGENEIVRELNGRGEFDSPECIRLLEECDIVATNPPFSKMSKYMATIIASGKKYITIMSNIHLMLKPVISEIVEKRLKIIASSGSGEIRSWFTNNGADAAVSAIVVTNLEKCTQPERILELEKSYDPELYPTFDDSDIINVDRVADIPRDYYGLMGIPFSALSGRAVISPEQFEVVGMLWHNHQGPYDLGEPIINGKTKFSRLVVRLKNLDKNE